MTTHCHTFQGVPEELGATRAWLRRLLDAHPCADDAELIISELATNAILHTASGDPLGTFHVVAVLTDHVLSISVTDGGMTDTVPTNRAAGAPRRQRAEGSAWCPPWPPTSRSAPGPTGRPSPQNC